MIDNSTIFDATDAEGNRLTAAVETRGEQAVFVVTLGDGSPGKTQSFAIDLAVRADRSVARALKSVIEIGIGNGINVDNEIMDRDLGLDPHGRKVGETVESDDRNAVDYVSEPPES